MPQLFYEDVCGYPGNLFVELRFFAEELCRVHRGDCLSDGLEPVSARLRDAVIEEPPDGVPFGDGELLSDEGDNPFRILKASDAAEQEGFAVPAVPEPPAVSPPAGSSPSLLMWKMRTMFSPPMSGVFCRVNLSISRRMSPAFPVPLPAAFPPPRSMSLQRAKSREEGFMQHLLLLPRLLLPVRRLLPDAFRRFYL